MDDKKTNLEHVADFFRYAAVSQVNDCIDAFLHYADPDKDSYEMTFSINIKDAPIAELSPITLRWSKIEQ